MLSLIIICKDVDDSLIRAIDSMADLQPQIIVDISDKDTETLGLRKNRIIKDAANEWILLLDSDEVVSHLLLKEIKEVTQSASKVVHGYSIPYQNYIFGKPIKYSGENYSKVRLFRKSFGVVSELPVHEEIHVKGNIEKLNGVIHHYSYISLPQVLKKFTKYAWQMAGEKRKVHEGVSPKKLFLYGPHMVWARAIKDEGWRDGWRGIVIALCFGYMETLMYWLLLWRNLINR